jgi:hypothetical protein
MVPLKGQSHKIFDHRFFSLNGTPGSHDSWAKAVLNIDSNWRSNATILFLFHGACKIIYDRFFDRLVL